MLEELLATFLPDGILEWFEIKDIENTGTRIRITFEEKNVVPDIPKKHRGKAITSKGFNEIILDDFPIRGKKSELVFLRRKWQINGVKKLLQRNLMIHSPGTKLPKDFADFLKELSRN